MNLPSIDIAPGKTASTGFKADISREKIASMKYKVPKTAVC